MWNFDTWTTFIYFKQRSIYSIYPNELEMKDTTECSTSALYLDVLLKIDTNGKLATQLYDKQTGWFQFLHRQFSLPI
jgi:hypothetical protein